MLSKEDLGKRIKESREEKSKKIGTRYTQVMLAKDVGISRGYLGDIEVGRKYPNYALISKIAEACEVPLSFFETNVNESFLRRNRKKKGLSLQELADQVGMDKFHLNMLEINSYNEKVFPPIPWERIIEVLDIPVNEFVFGQISEIQKKNMIKHDTRVIKYFDKNRDNNFNNSNIDARNFSKVPILGIVRSKAIYSDEYIENYTYIDRLIARVGPNEETFFLRVTGDAMMPSFQPDDLALIRRQPDVNDGEVAAVIIGDQEATLKKIYHANSDIWLHNTNPVYEPFKVPVKEVTILGKAIFRVGIV